MASKITKIVANFETQLGATLSPSATTGSLKSPVIDDDGVALPDGKYVMTVNIGNSKEEHLMFDLVGSTGAMSNIKSISRQGVETTGCVRQHRSGAKVTLTNFANLLYISNILMGVTPLDGASPLLYDVAPTLSNALQLATKGYVDSTLSGGVGTAGPALHGTSRLSKDQGAKQKARSTWAREQDTPDKTIKVESFRLISTDKVVNYSGGNTPNFIDPALGGDLDIALQPANGETVTITVDGVATILTFVTTIGVSAGNILIGASATTARANLVAFLNNPSVTSATQVAVTGANLTAIQKLSATDDLSLKAFIRVKDPTSTSFSVSETLAGAGNIWTVNSTKNRYDLVVIDSAGNLQIRKGSEAVSPTVPTPTNGDTTVCAVLNRVGQTTIRDYDVSGQGYITDWYDLAYYRTDLVTNTSPLTADFGDGSGGDVVISSNTNLTRDMFYNNLTINNGIVLSPKGFRIFVKNTLTFVGTGLIRSNGGNGGNATNGGQGSSVGSGGTGGTADYTAGSLPAPLAGATGGNGAISASGVAGGNGTNGTAMAKGLGSNGVAGANGGSGGTAPSGTGPGVGGTAGTAGTKTGTVFNLLNSIQSAYYLIDNQPTITTLGISASSGSSGGGGGGRSANGSDCGAGGGGGGSGATGGIVWVCAFNVVTVNGNPFIEAKGGKGGNGGNGGNSTGNNGGGGGGGGAGSGGSGGVAILLYKTKSGTGTIDVSGGTAGTVGAGGSPNGSGTAGTAGSAGTAGLSGVAYQIQL